MDGTVISHTHIVIIANKQLQSFIWKVAIFFLHVKTKRSKTIHQKWHVLYLSFPFRHFSGSLTPVRTEICGASSGTRYDAPRRGSWCCCWGGAAAGDRRTSHVNNSGGVRRRWRSRTGNDSIGRRGRRGGSARRRLPTDSSSVMGAAGAPAPPRAYWPGIMRGASGRSHRCRRRCRRRPCTGSRWVLTEIRLHSSMKVVVSSMVFLLTKSNSVLRI